jgi:coatomer subunit beta'
VGMVLATCLCSVITSPISPCTSSLQKRLISKSDRVKAVDIHPTEPWVLSALYSGRVTIWNYSTQTLWKTFEASDLPVRTARFVARKQWFVTGSDDMAIRAFNFNTSERVAEVPEAHSDYIRYLEAHPSQPLLLSCSDDMTIRLWNWDKQWRCMQTFEGHAHYVMMAKFNPKDSNTFSSASLDRSVKVWGLTSQTPNFSLEGHLRGVNCLDYYHGGDRPYIVSGADDFAIKVWDYQTKSCVSTLEGHTHNVSAVCFHPRLPVIVSGSEDGTVRIWHNSTYRLETTLNYGMERCWTVGCAVDSNKVRAGSDDARSRQVIIGGSHPPSSFFCR